MHEPSEAARRRQAKEPRADFVARLSAELHEIAVELDLGQKAVEDRKEVSEGRDHVHDSVRALRDRLDEARQLLGKIEGGDDAVPERARLERVVSELRRELEGLRRAETP